MQYVIFTHLIAFIRFRPCASIGRYLQSLSSNPVDSRSHVRNRSDTVMSRSRANCFSDFFSAFVIQIVTEAIPRAFGILTHLRYSLKTDNQHVL